MLFNRQINSITVAAIFIAFFSLVSRVLGVFRNSILVSQVGTGELLDSYYTAFRVPDLIFNLLILGALSAGFIPVFAKLIKDMKCTKAICYSDSLNEKAWNLVSNILNITIIFLSIFLIIGVTLSPYLSKIIAPGFSPESQKLTAELTRIMLLSPLFLGISGICGGVLQSFKRFFAYSLAPVMYNIGIIFGVLFFFPIWGIKGVAWGVILGAFLHMLIQLPLLFGLGFRYKFFIDFKDKEIRKIAKMMVPRTMSLGIVQLNWIVITIIASTLASGSLTIFNLANDFYFLPIGVFGVSFAIAAFPTMAMVADDTKKLVASFSSTIRQILFFIVPSTVFLMTLRVQIVRTILGWGKFSWEDTILTSDALGLFAISLFAQATLPLLARTFYAKEDSKTPFIIGLISALTNIFLSLYLSKLYGVRGLALAFSLASIVNFSLLWITLHIRLDNIDEKRIINSLIKFSLAGVLCGFVTQGVKTLMGNIVDMNRFWGVASQGFVAGLVGFSVYIFICYLLKSEEMLKFWESLRRKLPRLRAKDKVSGVEEV